MWSDLIKRWMDMALWWVPGRSGDAADPTGPADTRQASPRPQQPKPASEPADEAVSAAPTPTTAPEDLTTIKGIGPAMEKRLNKLGIHTRAELAAADPSGLTAKLKADKAVVSESQVSAWVTAAGQP